MTTSTTTSTSTTTDTKIDAISNTNTIIDIHTSQHNTNTKPNTNTNTNTSTNTEPHTTTTTTKFFVAIESQPNTPQPQDPASTAPPPKRLHHRRHSSIPSSDTLATWNFSKLLIDVIRARDLLLPLNTVPYVSLTYQQSYGQTECSIATRPFFNTNYTFDVEDSYSHVIQQQQSLVVTIHAQYNNGQNESVGHVSIPLSQLSDQYRHECWYPLSTHGSIHLSLLWLYDIPKLLYQLRDLQDTHRMEILRAFQLSKLLVDIIEITEVGMIISSSSTVMIDLDVQGSISSTDAIVVNPQTKSASWMTSFTFDVTPQDDIVARLILTFQSDDHTMVSDPILIDLSELSDQRRHTQWYTITHMKMDMMGKVHIHLLWLYDFWKLMKSQGIYVGGEDMELDISSVISSSRNQDITPSSSTPPTPHSQHSSTSSSTSATTSTSSTPTPPHLPQRRRSSASLIPIPMFLTNDTS